MKVTATQLPGEITDLDHAWEQLVQHCDEHRPDLVVLPEVPFAPWPFSTPRFDVDTWRGVVGAHESWIGRLGELDVPAVVGSQPVTDAGNRYNESFVWTGDAGLRPVHRKSYLPDEEGFWEASWYRTGDASFPTLAVGDATAGIMLCTEVWFSEHARELGAGGAQIVAVPRATERSSVERWIAAGRVAAMRAGAFCISSNRGGHEERTGIDWGGAGWIIDPAGEVLATTSDAEPFVTLDVELAVSDHAKTTYPRNTVGPA
ncbi:MAG: carbon-nitrogen hydrolase family protein [Nitriliruptorales bacterium]|nr:carbon-nitrogen hydrolase family protein [Nitriliruptorales bacterium]